MLIRTLFFFSFLLLICAGVVVLQVFLSKKENKWLGLILPIISFCVSLTVVFGMAVYTILPTEQTAVVQNIDENGNVLEEIFIQPANASQSDQPVASMVLALGGVFLLYNIPTVVLMGIYFACRESQKRKKALEKMQVQDLG